MKPTVLVTGGAGYVGSHACKALAAAGFQPITYDNLSRGHRDFVQWGPLVEGNIHDRALLADTMRQHSVQAVMHFAAYAYVGESVSDPGLYYQNNVGGTLSILQAMNDAGVKSLVFSSTCATYGIPDRMPITEATTQKPVNPYGRTKLQVEEMLHDFGPAYGLNWTALRYFNASGADPEGKIGERHQPETHAIPLAIEATLKGTRTFDIYGTDYPTPDGSAVRDYIHVADLATAHVAAIQRLIGGGGPAVFNLGTGVGVSVRELIAAVARATSKPVPHKEAPRRAGDPPILVADPAKAKAELGWQAAWLDIEATVASAVGWHKKEWGL